MPALFEIDASEVIATGIMMGAAIEQVPYAMSVALNKALEDTRTALIEETWPSHVHVRSPNFIRVSLRTNWANKTNLTATIYDALLAGHLEKQARGGTITAKGGSMAIPTSNITKGASGIPEHLKPRNLINAVRVGDVIYQKFSTDKNARKRLATRGLDRARLMYVLKTQVELKKRVPFYETFFASMRETIIAEMPEAVRKAMDTAFKRH